MTEETANYWIEDAKERLADNDRVIEEQEVMIADMHRVINQCVDALHQAQRALVVYIDIKNEFLKRKKIKPC